MSNIVISGYYGFNNAGDEALLTAILQALEAVDPETGITVISGNPIDTKIRHHVHAVQRFHAGHILQALSEADLLISGGGSLLQDVTSKKSLLYYLAVIATAKLKGCKVMLFAQGIGPIRNSLMRFLTKIVCRHADAITVRDADSAEELQRLGIPPEKVQVTADCVLTLEPADKKAGRRILEKAGLDPEKPILGISVRTWPDNMHCLQQLATAAAALSEKHDAQVAILPLQYSMDYETCDLLKNFMPRTKQPVVLLHQHFSTEEFLSIIGNFHLLVAMRLHALIFAAIMQVPLLAVSYDPKVDAFVKSVGARAAGTVDDLESGAVVEAADAIWDMDTAEQTEKISSMRTLARQNAEIAFSLLR
ncbi:MAG: polysaccharide pyruvyl transferase CsaB [Succiniclasticum sp.]|jgi:polysaccharide pyruvyl transferase CsaB|nr:polysaccharide pyruvyl transferase CsaB [Succiniclasticum sp.]MEE3479818.1 polysaccharide pyruvyl transferase CsaB [Succiniclasticum sp.]